MSFSIIELSESFALTKPFIARQTKRHPLTQVSVQVPYKVADAIELYAIVRPRMRTKPYLRVV
ncbi:MAG: hypothetical protein AAFU85_20725 [Planctomycetota bacterium]